VSDTLPEIEQMYRRQLMSRSGEDRFVMGALMFDAAREMVLASLPPGLTEAEVRYRLCERIYGAESDVLHLVRTALGKQGHPPTH
jgi:hypothetical protein